MLCVHECPIGLSPSEIAAGTSRWRASMCWYFHLVNACHWQYYHTTEAWMGSHWNTYRKATRVHFYFPMVFPLGSSSPMLWLQSWEFLGHHMAWEDSHYSLCISKDLCSLFMTVVGPWQLSVKNKQSEEEQVELRPNEGACGMSNKELPMSSAITLQRWRDTDKGNGGRISWMQNTWMTMGIWTVTYSSGSTSQWDLQRQAQ